LDKYYKVPFEVFEKELNAIVSAAEAKKIIALVKSSFASLDPKLVDNELFRRGYAELQEVL
jgi:hypothetical protein